MELCSRDGNMLQLSDMDIDPNTRKSSVFETLRIYEFKEIESLDDIDVDASIHINQSYLMLVIRLNLYSPVRINQCRRSCTYRNRIFSKVTSDNDQSIWEKLIPPFAARYGIPCCFTCR